jgi:RNA polymerase sigma-70 factor, ECF subfamily
MIPTPQSRPARSKLTERWTPIVEPLDWPAVLSLAGPDQQQALRRLHELMLGAARHQVWRMRDMLGEHGPEFSDDVANTAADEALAVLLTKLDTFEGRSRFTTWAYKFAILQAATEVRRQAWANREVQLDDGDLHPDPAGGPEQEAEAGDLAAAVADAMRTALTPYQRKIAVALLVDEVPIDVLAERLGTTRGALYKALHQARGRLRVSLEQSGHLPTDTRGGAR